MKQFRSILVGKRIVGCRYYGKQYPYVPWNMKEVTQNILDAVNSPLPPVTTTKKADRTSESNPANHTLDDVSKFYTVPQRDTNRLFALGGIDEKYRTQIDTFAELAIMIRRPAVEIINFLKKANYSKPNIRYVLYGPSQSGKSITLLHLLHYASLSNFIIFHIPWVPQIHQNKREASLSQTREGLVDVPLEGARILKHFQLQNSHLLNNPNMTIYNDYGWNVRESTPAGTPLSTFVAHGINRIKYSCDVVEGLVNELKLLATNGRCKVLVVVDGFNGCYMDTTRLKPGDNTPTPASRVSLVQSIISATQPDWSGGGTVVTLSTRATEIDNREFYTPVYLLKKRGFEDLDPFIPVSVPELSEREFHSLLDYYEDRKWLYRTDGREELQHLSSRLPGYLMQLCASL